MTERLSLQGLDPQFPLLLLLGLLLLNAVDPIGMPTGPSVSEFIN